MYRKIYRDNLTDAQLARLKEHHWNFYLESRKRMGHPNTLLLDMDGQMYHLLFNGEDAFMFPITATIFRS